MYQPKQFDVSDAATLHAALRAHPLGTLVTIQDGELVADEVPFFWMPRPAPNTRWVRELAARANPLWQRHDAAQGIGVWGGRAMVAAVCHRRARQGGAQRNHIVGAGQRAHDPQGHEQPLRAQLDAMTHSQEGQRSAPWAVSDAPADYIAQTMKAIGGIEIPIATLVGKW